MTQLDPPVNALIEAAIIWRQRDVGDDGPDAPVTGYERSLIEAVDAFLVSRHTLRESEGSKADLEFGSAEALRAEEASTAAALDMLDKANRRANRFAEQLGDLGQGLRKRGIRVEPTGFVVAALDHIDRLTTALDEAARDAHETVELEAVYDGGLSTDQEIRARAAQAAHPPFGVKTRTQVIDEIAVYIRDGSHIAIGPPPPRVSAEERSDDTKEDHGFGYGEVG